MEWHHHISWFRLMPQMLLWEMRDATDKKIESVERAVSARQLCSCYMITYRLETNFSFL